MIPQSFKDIISNGEYTGIFQTVAMVLFILIFLGLVGYVMSRPKKILRGRTKSPIRR